MAKIQYFDRTLIEDDKTYAAFYIDNLRTGAYHQQAVVSGAYAKQMIATSADARRLDFAEIKPLSAELAAAADGVEAIITAKRPSAVEVARMMLDTATEVGAPNPVDNVLHALDSAELSARNTNRPSSVAFYVEVRKAVGRLTSVDA